MAPCANCGAENREGAKFCGTCGSPLEPVCPACGAVTTTPGQMFCDECGAALTASFAPEAASAPVAEAHDIFERLGAHPWLARVESLEAGPRAEVHAS